MVNFFQNFVRKLKDHLLARRLGRSFDGDEHDDFSDEDRNTVRIAGDRLFEVGTCRINYTTYDNRRDYNTINPKSHPDIMVLSQDENRETQPFWYARVLKIYHLKVSTSHPQAHFKGIESMSILLVRWFGSEPSYRFGFNCGRLPKIGFVEHLDDMDNFAFGFLDPSQVLRGCHLIPAFAMGTTTELLAHRSPVSRQLSPSPTEDWVNYYVNM